MHPPPMLYLYCVTRKQSPLPDIRGLDGAPVRVVAHDEFLCFVSDTDRETVELKKDAALAHERVLEHAMESATILPFAFGHIVPSEDALRDELLSRHTDRLHAQLDTLDGKIEVNVKAFWLNLGAVLQRIAEKDEELVRLKAKKRLTRDEQIRAGERATKALEAMRTTFAEDMITRVADCTVDHATRARFSDAMITNHAFLIPRSKLSEFDEHVNAMAASIDDSIKLSYIGPVPPFTFVDLRMEARTT
jgi:hypothetical protein